MPSPSGSGPFHFRSGTGGSSWDLPADEEGIGSRAVGGKLLGLPRCLPPRHGLGVAWTGVENHPPEAPGLGRVASLLGQNGEVAKGEVAVDFLVAAAELVGTLQGQDPPPAGIGLGRLTSLAVEAGLRSRITVPGTLSFPSSRSMHCSIRTSSLRPIPTSYQHHLICLRA